MITGVSLGANCHYYGNIDPRRRSRGVSEVAYDRRTRKQGNP